MAEKDPARPGHANATHAKHGKHEDAARAKHDEAVHLAEEALEELEAGNEDEARFVLEEARRLDPEAVEDVVHDEAKSISGVPGTKPAGSE